MEGKNKNVDLPELAAATPLVWSENPNAASAASSRIYFMSSFQAGPTPYFMNHGAANVNAGPSSSSGTKASLRPPNPLFMNVTARNNNISDQNLYSDFTASAGNGVQIPGAGGQKVDPDVDPRKLRRILSNRLSAQKSRMKRLQHVAEVEKQAEALEAHIAILRPQVEKFTTQKQFLQLEQQTLNQQIAACTSRKQHIDAQIEIKSDEVIRLRQVQLAQQQQKLQAQSEMMGVWQSLSPDQMLDPTPKQTVYFNPNQAEVGEITEDIMRLNQLSLNQQQLENSGKMIPTPGWEPEQELLTNMGFSLNHPEPGQSFVKPITEQLGYEGMNSSVLGELEKMLNIDPLNHDSRCDFYGIK